MTQLDLFRAPRRPAKQNPRTMHVIDAGDPPGFGRNGGVRLECDVCGHKTGWVPSRGVEAEIKGRVCPRCRGIAPAPAAMKALTVWQPWATLIVRGWKPYEFRKWPAPEWMIGQRFVIHAAKRKVRVMDVLDLKAALDTGQPSTIQGASSAAVVATMEFLPHALRDLSLLPLSAGLGTAVMGKPVRCTDLFAGDIDPEEIDPEMWAWPMLDVEPFSAPVPCDGHQRFWNWNPLADAEV